jgi:hypothetical protein
MLSAFSTSPENSCAAAHDHAAQRAARIDCGRRDATCGVGARASMLHSAKMLVFLSRCSNPEAVLAILRALSRRRHSLRLGGQHGEEAKDEDEVSGEKGRAEDQAPEEEVSTRCFSVFDFERRR